MSKASNNENHGDGAESISRRPLFCFAASETEAGI